MKTSLSKKFAISDEPIELDERDKFAAGNEHMVLARGEPLSDGKTLDRVAKIPNLKGRARQKISFKALWEGIKSGDWSKGMRRRIFESAKEDLSKFVELGFPIIETILHRNVVLKRVFGIRQKVEYAMEQPFCKSAETLKLHHLWNDEKLLDDFVRLIRLAEQVRKEHKLGADLLGGKTIIDALKSKNPFCTKVDSAIYNLLVTTQDMTLARDMPELGKKAGDLLAPKNSFIMYDLRFFQLREWFDRIVDEIQFTTLWTVVETLGIEPDMKFDTLFRKFVRQFVRHGLTKVWNADEKKILPWRYEEPHLLPAKT